MIDLTREKPISLQAAAVFCGVKVQTVRLWARKLYQGRKLETAKLGGKRITTIEAVHRFQQTDETPQPINILSHHDDALQRNHQAALVELRALGY